MGASLDPEPSSNLLGQRRSTQKLPVCQRCTCTGTGANQTRRLIRRRNEKNSFVNGSRSKAFLSPGKKTARVNLLVRSITIITLRTLSGYFERICVIFCPPRFPV